MDSIKLLSVDTLELHKMDRGDEMKLGGFPQTATADKQFSDKPMIVISKNDDGTFCVRCWYLGELNFPSEQSQTPTWFPL